jgi:hypothetical protein
LNLLVLEKRYEILAGESLSGCFCISSWERSETLFIAINFIMKIINAAF